MSALKSTDYLDDTEAPLREQDAAETQMIYDHGKVPWFIGAMWVCALIGFAIYIARYLVPSLVSWGAP